MLTNVLMQECINELYETGFQNDKLSLLFLENQNGKIAIKTPEGISKRQCITNVVMQGTVWGSLCCTTTMDKLGKLEYGNKDLLYKYKDQVDIPSLGMVDDVLSSRKCSMDSVKGNAVINAFIESKKLTLNKSKCHRIHVSKNQNETSPNCPVTIRPMKKICCTYRDILRICQQLPILFMYLCIFQKIKREK